MQKLISRSDVEKQNISYVDDIEICHGTLMINYRESIGEKPIGFIEDVWTHLKHRRRGYARQLVLELIEMAKEKGCYKVVLNCTDDNIPFYSKIGFKTWQSGMRLDITK